MHRDIKPENILLVVDEFGKVENVKLADFGMVCKLGDQSLDDDVGTTGYQAPEWLKRQPHDEQCDSWSLGVLLYNYISGKMPFAAKYQYKVDFKAKFKEPKFKGKVWKQVSPEVMDLIKGCLEKDPANRLTTQDILDHPWMQDS